MTPSPYTEDTLVQQTTADYLEQQLGWESVILFDDSSGETRKILACNHQFLGVNRAVDAVRERPRCRSTTTPAATLKHTVDEESLAIFDLLKKPDLDKGRCRGSRGCSRRERGRSQPGEQ